MKSPTIFGLFQELSHLLSNPRQIKYALPQNLFFYGKIGFPSDFHTTKPPFVTQKKRIKGMGCKVLEILSNIIYMVSNFKSHLNISFKTRTYLNLDVRKEGERALWHEKISCKNYLCVEIDGVQSGLAQGKRILFQ